MVAPFFALLLAVAIPIQVFAVSVQTDVHVHYWGSYTEETTYTSGNSEEHNIIITQYFSCIGCDEILQKRLNPKGERHTFGPEYYTGENNHIVGTDQHRARYARVCIYCNYVSKRWETYRCSTNGQHIVPLALHPILTAR